MNDFHKLIIDAREKGHIISHWIISKDVINLVKKDVEIFKTSDYETKDYIKNKLDFFIDGYLLGIPYKMTNKEGVAVLVSKSDFS